MRFPNCISLLFLMSFVIAEVGGTALDYKTKGALQNKLPNVDLLVKGNEVSTQRPKRRKLKKKASRRQRCCHLGRRMAKIGESCTYVTTLTSIRPDYEHYHKLKTKVWVAAKTNKPIIKLLKKCKRHKAFYEKCCTFESRLIDQDLKRMIKRLRIYLREMRKGWKKTTKNQVTPFPVGRKG